MTWQDVVASAVVDGDCAEQKLSTRSFQVLLSLPVVRRQAAVDGDDPLLADLLPGDRALLRESLRPPPPGQMSPAQLEAVEKERERRALEQRRRALREYSDGYEVQIRAARDDLTEQYNAYTDASDKADGAIKCLLNMESMYGVSYFARDLHKFPWSSRANARIAELNARLRVVVITANYRFLTLQELESLK